MCARFHDQRGSSFFIHFANLEEIIRGKLSKVFTRHHAIAGKVGDLDVDAAPGTRLSVLEIKWGLVPDMAGTQLMRHLARDDVIRELTYTGRMFEAEEGQELGFVTRVVEDPRAAAMEAAAAIARRNPDAIRAEKHLLNESLYLDRAEGLLLESKLQDRIIGTPNQIEAVMSELEGREPKYA